VILDGDRASGVSYCLAHHVTRRAGEAKIMVASIRYSDQFVRTPEGWRFDEGRLMVDWMDTRAVGS
jgi:hypothetical protein